MSTFPDRLCECGCGALAPRAKNHENGWRKGESKRFVKGHHARCLSPPYQPEDRGYATPCWIWQRALVRTGYGVLYVRRKRYQAHRYFYEQHRGPIPTGLTLDHLCRVPACVNPEHLDPVTHRENIRRGKTPKLSVEIAAEIRKYKADFFAQHPYNSHGEPRQHFPQGAIEKLANRYGVATTTIAAVLAGRQWL